MPNDYYLVCYPVRGLLLSDGVAISDIWDRPWSLVAPSDFKALSLAHGKDASLDGNINSIVLRLQPSCLLLIRYHGNEPRKSVWDEDRAERISAVLNLAMLLSEHLSGEPMPIPVYRARYIEYCDLLLSFDKNKVKTVGHSSRMGILALGNPGSGSYVSLQLVNGALDGSSLFGKIIRDDKLFPHERHLLYVMTAIQNAFNTVSRGAFISACVSAMEMLVDPGSGDPKAGDSSWKMRVNRLLMLLPENHHSHLERILEARHQYVHEAVDPSDDSLTFISLAVTVYLWSAMEQTLKVHQSIDDVIRLLDCCRVSRAIQAPSLSAVRSMEQQIHRPRTLAKWMAHFMASPS
jgi:hypothetical protein